MWGAVAFWIVLYGAFLFFVPFYKKGQRRPASAYLAFVIAFALEMHGIPFSMYLIGALFGVKLPAGFLWGHTLQGYVGLLGMYVAIVLGITDFILVYLGWRDIHREYWSKESGEGELVTRGVYARIRHPQYTGFLLVTLAMLCEWATIPLLIMWPMMVVMYYRLALREERDMEREFGEEYVEYRRRTGMFVPRLASRA